MTIYEASEILRKRQAEQLRRNPNFLKELDEWINRTRAPADPDGLAKAQAAFHAFEAKLDRGAVS
jgi:hypothetical protein